MLDFLDEDDWVCRATERDLGMLEGYLELWEPIVGS
jgi:hypothetical protein